MEGTGSCAHKCSSFSRGEHRGDPLGAGTSVTLSFAIAAHRARRRSSPRRSAQLNAGGAGRARCPGRLRWRSGKTDHPVAHDVHGDQPGRAAGSADCAGLRGSWRRSAIRGRRCASTERDRSRPSSGLVPWALSSPDRIDILDPAGLRARGGNRAPPRRGFVREHPAGRSRKKERARMIATVLRGASPACPQVTMATRRPCSWRRQVDATSCRASTRGREAQCGSWRTSDGARSCCRVARRCRETASPGPASRGCAGSSPSSRRASPVGRPDRRGDRAASLDGDGGTLRDRGSGEARGRRGRNRNPVRARACADRGAAGHARIIFQGGGMR